MGGAWMLTRLAVLFSLWELVNGVTSFADHRDYPQFLRSYFKWHYGSVPRGKNAVMGIHRAVGALAYIFIVAAAAMAISRFIFTRYGSVFSSTAVVVFAFASLSILLPSLERG